MVIWELECLELLGTDCNCWNCLELQHPIISIFGIRYLKNYFPDISFTRAHILRTLFIFRAEKVFVKMVYNRNFSLKVLNFWFLCTGFYCIEFMDKAVS